MDQHDRISSNIKEAANYALNSQQVDSTLIVRKTVSLKAKNPCYNTIIKSRKERETALRLLCCRELGSLRQRLRP